MIRYTANLSKLLEIMVYLANKKPGTGPHWICKMMYFADKYHLNKYVRPVSGDNYVAMSYGPVPSGSYSILKKDMMEIDPEFIGDYPFEIRMAKGILKSIKAKRKPNLKLLSKSDIEALDYAVASYHNFDFTRLTDDSHDDAWHIARRSNIFSNNPPIQYENMFESTPEKSLLQEIEESAPDLVF